MFLAALKSSLGGWQCHLDKCTLCPYFFSPQSEARQRLFPPACEGVGNIWPATAAVTVWQGYPFILYPAISGDCLWLDSNNTYCSGLGSFLNPLSRQICTMEAALCLSEALGVCHHRNISGNTQAASPGASKPIFQVSPAPSPLGAGCEVSPTKGPEATLATPLTRAL